MTEFLRKSEFAAGEVLFEERRPAEAIFVIESGGVRVSKRVHTIPCQIETLGVGDVLGESALFSEAVYSVTAVAVSQTRCLVVSGSHVPEMAKRSPDIALRIMRKLALRLIHGHYRLSNFTLRKPKARLMHQLLAEFERAEDKGHVPIPYDLPEVLSLEHGTVDEMVRNLIKDGHISVNDNGTFTLANSQAYSRFLTFLELHDRFAHIAD